MSGDYMYLIGLAILGGIIAAAGFVAEAMGRRAKKKAKEQGLM